MGKTEISPEEIKKIARNMRRARLERDLSLPELALMAGIGENTLRYYENGRVAPGLLNLILLANVLDISLDEYIGRETRNKPASAKTDFDSAQNKWRYP